MHSAIYRGWLEHRRAAPRRHAFRYPLFMVYLDLAELDRVFAGRWLWSTRRPALLRFDRRDHLGDPAIPLDQAVRDLVAERTGTRPQGPIRLLTHLRYLRATCSTRSASTTASTTPAGASRRSSPRSPTRLGASATATCSTARRCTPPAAGCARGAPRRCTCRRSTRWSSTTTGASACRTSGWRCT